MSKTAINDLQALINKLQAQRKTHIDAVADIDEAFGSLGIQPTKRRGRPRGAKKATAWKAVGKKKAAKKVRTRKKFKTTTTASVLAFVKKSGKKGVTGGQITKQLKAEGRSTDGYNAIGILVKAKQLKRHAIKGKKRGSLYTA